MNATPLRDSSTSDARPSPRSTDPTAPPSPPPRRAAADERASPAILRPEAPSGGPARHLILLPTLNEEAGLEATLSELARVAFRSPQSRPSIAVIDGHSTDGTQQVAQRWGVTWLPQRSKGKGAAIREGLAWAAQEGFEAVAVLDADGTYDGAAIPAVFDLLDLGRELVVGVRRRETSSRRSARDIVHRVGNGLLNYAAAQFTRQPLLDICSGFWGIRTSVLADLALESDGFDIESELFVKAFRRRLRIAQIPVAYRKRVGAAKLHAVRDGSRILLSILRYSLRRPPRRAPPSGDQLAVPEPAPLLNAVLLGLGPEHIVLMSAADRLPEAEAVVRRLTAAVPTASVVRAILPSYRASPAREVLLPALTGPADGVGSTVVVALPSRDRFSDEPSPVWLGIPRTGRIVCLRARGSKRRPSSPVDAATAPRLRRERLPVGALGAVQILCGSLEPTWARRELALLAANTAGYPMEVARQDPTVVGPPRRIRPSMVRRPVTLRRLVGG